MPGVYEAVFGKQKGSFMSQSSQHHVVIVGGGFAGLYAARALGAAPVKVTLIDKNNFHLFQPMLYQVATGELPADDIAAPLRAVLAKQKNTEVLMAEVTGVDVAAKQITMGKRSLSYDTLILATGSHYNYFGHPEWQQIAPSLKTAEDAVAIRSKILQAFEAAEQEPDPDRVKALLTFVLVGAGPTGVELAGSIRELITQTLAGEFRHIKPDSAQVIIVEAGSRILSAFPEDIAAKTKRHLEDMTIELRLNTKVEAIDADGVTASGQRIPARTVLWTAGTIGSDAAKWVGAETDKDGRAKVGPDLSLPGHPEIFVLGDTAAVTAPVRDLLGRKKPHPEPMPGLAPAAMQEGSHVAKVIRSRVAGRAAPSPFEYWDKGNLAQVSRGYAIIDLGFVKFVGILAWLIWLGVHIFYLIGFANRLLVLFQWGVTVLVSKRGDCVLPEQFAPDVPKPAAT